MAIFNFMVGAPASPSGVACYFYADCIGNYRTRPAGELQNNAAVQLYGFSCCYSYGKTQNRKVDCVGKKEFYIIFIPRDSTL